MKLWIFDYSAVLFFWNECGIIGMKAMNGMAVFLDCVERGAVICRLASQLIAGRNSARNYLSFHSGESRNLCGDSRIRRQATIPLRGKFSLARE